MESAAASGDRPVDDATAGPWATVRSADVYRDKPWAQHRLRSRVGISFDITTEASTDRIAHDLTIGMADRDFPGRPTRQTSNFTPSQIGVFAAYATTRGRALVDRELYPPKSWTKGELAKRLVLRALASDQFEAFLTGPNCSPLMWSSRAARCRTRALRRLPPCGGSACRHLGEPPVLDPLVGAPSGQEFAARHARSSQWSCAAEL
ncbi:MULTISPECIES: hypothetical protein [unclassified Streptomyces]|uniref:hypothetical protein n=1 Tax=unclassified Streptomyces TaxID=2593676 RepID=UPI003445D463